MGTAGNFYRNLLGRWVDLVRRWAVIVVLATILASAGIMYYVASNLGINTDTEDMLSPELPFRKNIVEIDQAFPQFTDNVLIVIDGVDPDRADDAAAALTARLRERPDLLQSVYYPSGLPFFRRNGLLYSDAKELSDLSDRLAEAQPFLGTLARDPSLPSFLDVLSLAIDETLDERGDASIAIDFILDAVADVVEAWTSRRAARLSWQELMTGTAIEANERRRFIVVQPALNFGSLQPAAEAIAVIRQLAGELDLDQRTGVRVRLTGPVALDQEELKSVKEGMGIAATLSTALVLGLLTVGLRSRRLVFATLGTLVVGLVWTAGFATAVVGQLNLISVAFVILFIGLSVDFGIHFGLRYKEDTDRGAGHPAALRQAAMSVGGALTLNAVAMAIAFLSFLPTAYVGLAELGLISGAGMLIALFANLTVLPALLTLAPLRMRAAGERGRPRRRSIGLQIIGRHHKAIAGSALVLAVVAAAVLPQVQFDFDPLNLKDPETESVSTFFDLMEDSGTNPYTITVLTNNLEAADRLAVQIGRLDEVDETRTLTDFVPGAQREKLEIIETTAVFLLPALIDRQNGPSPTAERRRKALLAFRGKLEKLANQSTVETEIASARRLLAAVTALDGAKKQDQALEEIEFRLLSSLPSRLEALRRSLTAEAVTLENLPDALRQRHVAPDGRARLEVFPKEDLRDTEALRQFVEAVRTIAPNATGTPVTIFEAGNAVVVSFLEAAAISVILISFLMIVLMRGIREVFLVFAPLMLAALFTVAATVVLDLPFNFANVIVLPLLFGLGVASAIHLIMRERDEAGFENVLQTTTPRAVLFSALTTIGSFGSIALSSHPGTSSMGTLLTIAIAFTLVSSLIVAPALMFLWPRSGSARQEQRVN